MMTPYELKAMNTEWLAWKNIWKWLEEKIGADVGKEKEWRPLAELIERWAYYDRARRDALKQSEDYKPDWEFGIFWDGDKEEPSE